MNKLVKGSIAGGLGVVLLLGGAGTLALWNQTAVVAGGNVTAGLLTIDATGGAQSWRDISAEVVNPTTAPDGVAIADIANYKIVPGDKIKFTKVVTVKATGDHLKGKLSYDDATIVAPVVAGATAQNTANADLKAKLLPTFTATGTGVTSTTTGGVTEYFVTPVPRRSTPP